jgi:hypothetical protein
MGGIWAISEAFKNWEPEVSYEVRRRKSWFQAKIISLIESSTRTIL